MKEEVCVKSGQNMTESVQSCPDCKDSDKDVAGGVLKIVWKGAWALFDNKLQLSVNGKLIGVYSYKKGFIVEVPIENDCLFINLKCSFLNFNHTAFLDPAQNYTCMLNYDKSFGKFEFVIV